jgi:ABC-type nitrate/sulfonate/bicarbonate transport system permease component
MANLENTREGSATGTSTRLTMPSLCKTFASKKYSIISIALVTVALAIWEAFARAGMLSKIIFPAPTLILQSLWKGIWAGKFTEDFQVSATRIILGFLIGGGSGLVLGMLMGWSRRLRGIFDPIIAALHPIPKFALLPMIIIFFGLGESSRIAMVSMGAFFPMVVNAMTGVLQINPVYYEVMENYGASRFDIFRRVVFPGSLPFALSGARLSLRSSLTITIGVEMVFGNTGLGSRLWLAWETMRMTDMYSVLIIIAVVGVGIFSLLESTKRYLIPWHHENSRER